MRQALSVTAVVYVYVYAASRVCTGQQFLREIPLRTGDNRELCCQHLLRDLAAAALEYPGAHWPVQITQALQGAGGRAGAG